jgi:hypothetical protein
MNEGRVNVNFRFFRIDHLVFILLISFGFSFLASLPVDADDPAPKAPPPPDINTALMRSTFKIVGSNESIGTVFLLGKPKPNSKENFGYSVLVTAAHVLEKIPDDSAIIFFRRKDGDRYIKIPCRYQIRRDGKPLWVKHPKADVAAMFIIPPINSDILLVPSPYLSTDQMLEEYEIYPGREIKVLGFPFGRESNSAGFPILRTGSIASFPLTPADREITFLVDFRVFEGNSGGPVYFHDTNWRPRVTSEVDIRNRLLLLANPDIQIILGLVSEEVSVTETTQSHLQEVKQKYPISVAEVIHGTLIQETIDLLSPQPLPENTCVPLREMTFLNEALTHLQEKIPDESLAKIKAVASDWERNPTDSKWSSASDAVTFEAAKYKITSALTIVSLPTKGATIKYQTVGKRDRKEAPITAGQTTICTETVPIGLYHIWTERDGKPTSERDNIYHVINTQHRIEITEHVTPSNPR